MTPLERLLTAAPDEQQLTRACAAMVEGAHGAQQPECTLLKLATLEHHGLAQWTEEHGWSLTTAGKVRRRMFLELGRDALRALGRAGRA